MKLNEVNFFWGIVIIHFLNKTYQEIHLKSQLNSVLQFNYGKIFSELQIPVKFYFTLLASAHFCNTIEWFRS